MKNESGTYETRLRELALRHGVRYEVLPDMQVVDGQVVRVGFDVQLYGLHEHPEGVTPGCPECARVYAALREIAAWILPTEERPSRYEIEGFDRALHLAPDLTDRDEVRLEVKVLHRRDFFAPIDRCEKRCLAEMKQKLARLGVREGARRPRPPGPSR
ncbi:MAG: hypothetical protein ACYC8T_38975 [Myxococcaceae bacterium]